MKKNILLSFAVLLLCTHFAIAQKKIVKVETFSRISFGYPGKLYITQGSPQKVELEGNKEVLDKINVEVENNKLTIAKEDSWFNWSSDNESIIVRVTVENIEEINVSGSGSVIAETKLTCNQLDLKVSGSGSMQAEVVVHTTIEANVSGSGRISLKGSAKNLESNVSGSGKIEVDAIVVGSAQFSVSGSGRIEASGIATSVKTSISGSGRLLAANLETNKCDVRISGSGNVEINVKNDLDVHISGSGSVAYKGNPSHLNTNSSGSGTVKKI